MFSDEEIKELPGGSYMRPGDEIISIREVCLADKFDGKNLGLHLLPSSSRNDLDSRSLFRDNFFPEGLEGQARFAWTEEDGNIASLVSEPGFGTTGQTTFGRQIDAALKSEMKEADTSSSVVQPTNRGLSCKHLSDIVSSTSSGNPSLGRSKPKASTGTCKVDKADPRSRYHFVKYVKRHGRTVKLWECGICSREFQHQYTLMRHLPTHTDERNFHCDVCGKSFRQLSTLSQHRAIHSAERPYSCEVCNKTFNRVSTLISHRKTHTNATPYKCHLCPKGFHQKGNLRNHLFTHTNERPYRCNVCYKGFNQQSNLVCHKNKAHPEKKNGAPPAKKITLPRAPRRLADGKADEKRLQKDNCEVSSSVGPYLSNEGSSSWQNRPFESSEWGLTSGVIVDQIKTYQMELAVATQQTPFALLKPDNASPVLVKVVNTSLPGGKQMLVPATAEDLRSGGKIVVKEENDDIESQEIDVESSGDILHSDGAVQIRVPVVATVVPRITGGRLHLAVEEPHCAYHTTLSADVGEVKIEPCSEENPDVPRGLSEPNLRLSSQREPRYIELNTSYSKTGGLSGSVISSTCSMPAPALSPPLDLIAMDLFEPMECMPLGPQITAVDNIDHPPPSDDSDIFIGEFEESIQLSDSD